MEFTQVTPDERQSAINRAKKLYQRSKIEKGIELTVTEELLGKLKRKFNLTDADLAEENDFEPRPVFWPFTNRCEKFKTDVLCQIIQRVLGPVKCYHPKQLADSIVFKGTVDAMDKIQDLVDYHMPRLIAGFEDFYMRYLQENDLLVPAIAGNLLDMPNLDKERHRGYDPVENATTISKIEEKKRDFFNRAAQYGSTG